MFDRIRSHEEWEQEIEEGWSKCFEEVEALRKELKEQGNISLMISFSDIAHSIKNDHVRAQAQYVSSLRALAEEDEEKKRTGGRWYIGTTKDDRKNAYLISFESALKTACARLVALRSLVGYDKYKSKK